LSGEVTVQSGAQVITQPGIQVSGAVQISGSMSVSGNIVSISGNEIIAKVSGEVAHIAGYYSESGDWRDVHVDASGELMIEANVSISSGLHVVTQPGIQVSGTVSVSGIVGVSGRVSILSGRVAVSSGEVHVLSGIVNVASGVMDVNIVSGIEVTVDISGDPVDIGSGIGVLVSGQQTAFSGHGASYPFNPFVGGANISGLIEGWPKCETVINLLYGYVGQPDVWEPIVTDANNSLQVYVVDGSVRVSGAVRVSGIVGVSGRVSILSGLVGVTSGEVHILSGEVTVESGVQVITQPGIQISGAVIVSGLVGVNSGRVDILSGEVHILSGIVNVASGMMDVNIVSGIEVTVDISGDPVTISGDHVYVESGSFVLISGQVTVPIIGSSVGGELGINSIYAADADDSVTRLVNGIAYKSLTKHEYAPDSVALDVYVVDIMSGVVGVSVLSGVGILSGEVHVMSGELIAKTSGEVAHIAGYYSESGDWRDVHVDASGELMIEANVTVAGAQVSGAVIVSGLVGVNSGRVDVLSGEVHILSGEVTVAGGVQVSGTVAVSGEVTAIVQSGAQVITQPGIQVSGAVIVSGSMSVSGNVITMSGNMIETHIMSGEVTIQSGAQVITQPGIQVSGAVIISGLVGVNSGEVHILSGEVTIQSGAQVIIQPGIQVSGAVIVSGDFSIASGAQVITQPGIQVSGTVAVSGEVTIADGVQVSGTVAVSGEVTAIVQSGAQVITQPGIQVSGAVIISGLVGVNSGRVDVLSGEVHILSGTVDIEVPTSLLTNAVDNPQLISDNSGGDIITSGSIISVVVKAVGENATDMYVGGHTATHMPYSGHGMVLAAGEAMNLDIAELGYVKACATTSGDKLSYIAVT